MEILWQSAFSITTDRLDGDRLRTEAMYIATDYEAGAVLISHPLTTEIKSAEWSVHRTIKNIQDTDSLEGRVDLSWTNVCAEGDLPELVGLKPMAGGIAAMRMLESFHVLSGTAPEGAADGLDITGVDRENVKIDGRGRLVIEELFMECFRAACFMMSGWFMKERGFDRFIDHEADAIMKKQGTCRPFNNGAPSARPFGAYCGGVGYARKRNLYNKYKSCVVRRIDGRNAESMATYNDSYHEIFVSLIFEPETGVIKNADMQMIRVPYNVCRGAISDRIGILEGKTVDELNDKIVVGGMFGNFDGCFHLVDIVFDCIVAAGNAIRTN